MTEITDRPQNLPAVIERFVLHWGDMGSEWGVNRSVSQIHALLYLSNRPLTAEEIADLLGLARSNVSTSIKELLAWSLIRRVPIKGDRRDHFEAETDLWEIVTRIVAGRKEREIDPAVATLQACVKAAEGDPTIDPVARRRLKEVVDESNEGGRLFHRYIEEARSRAYSLWEEERKKEEERLRRAEILEQYKLKKAIEEAEREVG